MRIGIDARELVGRPTGVGRYLAGLLREWARGDAAPAHEFVLYAHAAASQAVHPFRSHILPGTGGTLWEQRALARAIARDEIDVLFSPAYSTPLMTSIPRAVAIHDVSFAAHPEWFRWREGVRRRMLAQKSAVASTAVLTISQFSKREIATRFSIDTGKIHVVPPGIDPLVDAPSIAAGALLLYVGSLFNRRHIPDLISGFARVARHHPDASLHIVGENRTHPPQDVASVVSDERMDAQVHCRDYVSEAELRGLYSRARAFAFLSEYEGLGLTPLEALASGVPSVLLDTPVARESCGDAAIYVQTTRAEEVGAAVERLLYDEPTRQRVLAAAPGVLARYNWARAAADTLRIITDVRPRPDSTGSAA